MSVNYPVSLDNGTSLPNPSATNDTNSPSLSSGQVLQNTAVIALETKVGINSSTATANTVLLGTGTGASTWGTLTSSYVTSATGSGSFVFATSPTVTGATLTTPTINNPTLNTDSVVGYTTDNDGTVYGISVSGGKITSSSAFSTGVILPSALVAGTGSSWTWQSWTPTWTNLTIGNATVTAQYIQTGQTVNFSLDITFGSTTSMGTAPIFTLPVNSVAPISGYFRPSGTSLMSVSTTGTVYYGYNYISSTTTCYIEVSEGITPTAPFTWTTGSVLSVTGTYQA